MNRIGRKIRARLESNAAHRKKWVEAYRAMRRDKKASREARSTPFLVTDEALRK